jgi:hypothetical protein
MTSYSFSGDNSVQVCTGIPFTSRTLTFFINGLEIFGISFLFEVQLPVLDKGTSKSLPRDGRMIAKILAGMNYAQ